MGVIDASGFIPPGNIDPFLTDTVIVKVLAKVDVNHLKKLRNMGIKWNHLIIKILERKASILGQLKAVDLTKEPCGVKIANFLHSSSRNPGIFRSFILDFESLKANCNFISQSKAYSPLYLKLHITSKYSKDDSKALNRFLAVIAPEIRELEVHARKVRGEEEYLYFYYQPLSLVFPKLKRFACIGNSDESLRHLFRPFIFLMSKDGYIDHTPNLTTLEMKTSIWAMHPKFFDQLTPVGISRWSRLTKLAINFTDDYRGRSTIFLQLLGQGGMRLESLDFKYARGEWPSNCLNLSNFFQTQAKSLKILDFTCNGFYRHNAEVAHFKINLPNFEVLHTFKLDVGPDDVRIFEMGPLSAHFPKLAHLETNNCEFLASFFPENVPTSPIHLQSLNLYHNHLVQVPYFDIWKNTFKRLGDQFKMILWDKDQCFGTDQLIPLELSRWPRLTQLTILCCTGQHRPNTFLHSLDQGGMKLGSLNLLIHPEETEWLTISRNLSEYLQIQAKSLEILDFTCDDILPEDKEGVPKIQLPIFEVLHTLKLKSIASKKIRMFEMRSLPINFPKVDHLEVNKCNLLALLFPEGVPIDPMRLESLAISSVGETNCFDTWKETFELLGHKFQYVADFRCDGSLLQGRAPEKSCVQSLRKFLGLTLVKVDERKLPWSESLKTLEINGINSPLKLSHLNGLKKLIVTERHFPENLKMYLAHFKDVRRLKLSQISFQFYFQIPKRVKNKFVRYFPFPVEFKTLEV